MPPQIITADFNVNERKAEARPDASIYSPQDLRRIALTPCFLYSEEEYNFESILSSFTPLRYDKTKF